MKPDKDNKKRAKAVALAAEVGPSEAARRLGMSKTTLLRWSAVVRSEAPTVAPSGPVADREPKVGRPTKLTPEVQAKIVEAMGRGHYLDHAAALAGVMKQTVYNWVERGESGEEPFASFLDALKEAEAEAADASLKAIRAAQGGDKDSSADLWTNHAWFLERRYPKKFGRTVQEQVHSGTKTVRIEGIEKLSVDEMRQVLAEEDEGE